MPLVFPQEVIVWKILPAVKARLARKMKDAEVPQKEIAELLNVTESSVSQYLSGKRGYEFKIPEQFDPMIDVAIHEIRESRKSEILVYMIGQICNELIKSEEGVALYKKLSGFGEDCHIALSDD